MVLQHSTPQSKSLGMPAVQPVNLLVRGINQNLSCLHAVREKLRVLKQAINVTFDVLV
jgi:hypothetical protein